MRYLMVILVMAILTCKGNKPESANTDQEVLEQKETTPSTSKEALVQNNSNASVNDIPICELDKRDQELYAMFVQPNEMAFADELGGRLYYGSGKKAFDELFISESINCIVPVSGKGYTIFDMYYNEDLSVETIYNGIIGLKKNPENVNTYHDFFKRGLVFILSKDSNKLTMVSFNPFINNELPKQIEGYFNDEAKYDGVSMIIGIGQVKVLVE